MNGETERAAKPLSTNKIAAIGAAMAALVVTAGSLFAFSRGDISVFVVHATVGTAALVLYTVTRSRAPLELIKRSARRVAAGDYTVRIDLGNRPELRDLSSAFNAMAETIQDRNAELTRKAEEATVLYEASRAMSSTLDLDTLLDSTLETAIRSFGVDSGYLVLRDPETRQLRMRASRGVAVNAPDARAVRASMSEWVVAQGRPLIFNPPTSATDAANVDAITGALAAVCVPLQSSEGVIGAIAVGSREPSARFGPEDVRCCPRSRTIFRSPSATRSSSKACRTPTWPPSGRSLRQWMPKSRTCRAIRSASHGTRVPWPTSSGLPTISARHSRWLPTSTTSGRSA
jgi:HAMP domain-containing protein